MTPKGTDRANADKQTNRLGLRTAYNANSPAAAISKGTVVALVGGGKADRVEAVTLNISSQDHVNARWAVARGGLRNSGGVDSDGVVTDWAYVALDTSAGAVGDFVYWNGTALTLTPAAQTPRVGRVQKVGTVAAGGNVYVDPEAYRRTENRQLVEQDVGDGNSWTAADLRYSNGGAISLSVAAAETRGIPAPSFQGQEIIFVAAAIAGGDCVITATGSTLVAGGAANGTATFPVATGAGTVLGLRAVPVGPALVWRAFINDGVTLA